MASPRVGTVALVVRFEHQAPVLVDQLSDDREIAVFEKALRQGEADALEQVYDLRKRQQKEDEAFGDYVEDLLSKPYVRPEIQEHGLQWLKSKLKIEKFAKCEHEASLVIAHYAFKVYQEEPKRTDFLLAGPLARVRIRILVLSALAQNAA